jgi:hypothetical protein
MSDGDSSEGREHHPDNEHPPWLPNYSSWAEAPPEDLVTLVELNPFQEDKLEEELRQEAEQVTKAMLEAGQVPGSPWIVLRALLEQQRRQLVSDLLEAQQRLREALARTTEDPATWPAEMQRLAKEPGAFRERPYYWPGPAQGRVRDLVRWIVVTDFSLQFIAAEEAREGWT